MVHSRQEALSGWVACLSQCLYLSLLTLPYGALTPGRAVWVGGRLVSMFISAPLTNDLLSVNDELLQRDEIS